MNGDGDSAMSNAPKSQKGKMQKTLAPVKEDRIDIPIPTRGEFFRNLKKAAQPSGPRRSKKQSPK